MEKKDFMKRTHEFAEEVRQVVDQDKDYDCAMIILACKLKEGHEEADTTHAIFGEKKLLLCMLVKAIEQEPDFIRLIGKAVEIALALKTDKA